MNYRRLFVHMASVATFAATLATPVVASAEERHGSHSGPGPGHHDAARVDEHQRGRGGPAVEVRQRDELQDVNEPQDVNDDRGVDPVDND